MILLRRFFSLLRTDFFDEKLIKFICVGVVNTLVGMAIMFGLYNLAGCSYWVSSATNYILTSILSYFLNKKFTFQNKDSVGGTAVRFTVNIAVCYLLAYGIAKPLVRVLLADAADSLRDNCSMLVGMVLFTAFNYIGQRFFAFRTSDKAEGKPIPVDVWIRRLFYVCVIAAACLMVCMNGSGLALLLVFAAIWIPYRFRIPHFLPILIVASTAVHLIAVFAVQPEPISDFLRMYEAAVQAANGDFSFQNTTYFFNWAYQTGFVLWEALLIKLFHSMMSLKIANALLLTGINCLIYLLARRFVDERAAQAASLLYLVTIFPTLLCCVLTNQHVSAFFLLLGLYVLTSGDKRAFSLPRAIAAGVLLALGNIMRPEGIVIIAALCGTAVFVAIMHRSLHGSRRMLCGVAVSVIVYAVCLSAASWAVSATGSNTHGLTNNWPEWKFLVGFNSDTGGWFSEEDAHRFSWAHEIDTSPDVTAQVVEIEKQVIRERMFTSPAKLAQLMLSKVHSLWITDRLGFPLGHINRPDYRVFGMKGTVVYQYFSSLDCTVYAFAMLFALLGAITLLRRGSKKQTFPAVLAPMTVMASFAVFLLIEVQPRYVFLPQIFLYLTAAAGIAWLGKEVKRRFLPNKKETPQCVDEASKQDN